MADVLDGLDGTQRLDREATAGRGTWVQGLPWPVVMLLGALAGALWGVLARAWMRLISEDPEFSWSGTLAIVVVFTVTGTTQAFVWLGRRAGWRRRWLTPARVVGGLGLLPLGTGAGVVMLPTIVVGALALSLTSARRWVRALLLAVALAPLVLVVGTELVDGFGWGPRLVLGLLGATVVYAGIVVAAQATFATQQDGWRLLRRADRF